MTAVASVAVVIPFYNGSAFIERALQSVRNQTRQADDIIVVNDGSNDTESDFLAAIADKYHASVIHQDNAGQSAARNTGVRATTATHICFLDQDDYFLPNHIDVLAHALADSPADGLVYAYGDAERVDLAGEILETGVAQVHSTQPKRTLDDCVSEDMFILPSASMIPRAMFEAVGGFEPTLRGYEDDDFFLRAFLAGYSGVFIGVSVVAWTLNPSSSSNSPEMAESRFNYVQRLVTLLSDRSDSDRSVLERVVIPRFLNSFAYDVIHSRMIDSDFRRAEELFGMALKLAQPHLPQMSKAARRLVRVTARFVALPEKTKKFVATIVLSRRVKFLRSRVWRWTIRR